MLTPWPHQSIGIEKIIAATERGVRRILVTSPTGGGKTLMMELLARLFLERGGKGILYSNRRYMVDQLSNSLHAAGLYHGVRAAGADDEREMAFQISSIQTEHSRVTKNKTWELHAADLVLVDEAHIQTGNSARELLRAHHEAGATLVGLTATPLGLSAMYDELIIAGTMSELRSCGALVPCVHFGADEPDLKAFKKAQDGRDPTNTEQKKAIMTPTIFGRVWEWYEKLNQQRKPCILFGPGVDESLWFAERFLSKGVKSAHIDGADVWIGGTWYKSDQAARDAVRDGSRSGDVKVVCNRYVLREGVDWPWIEHVILAFVAGSLQTYLQTVGRGLRACPSTGKKELIVQDHGGAWWRHGSINVDRQWELELTEEIAYGLRAERLRKTTWCGRCKKFYATKEPNCQVCGAYLVPVRHEPFRCPQCGRVWMSGTTCQAANGGCGFELGNRRISRPVVTTEGELREMTGDIFKPRRISKSPHGAAAWKSMYFRSRTEKGARTFRAAMALFASENNYAYPDPQWPFMPVEDMDYFKLVGDVPRERLR